MDIFVNINQNSKDLLDIIPVISVIITAWIAFTVYIFNYLVRANLGNLEINNDTNDKLIPILVSVMFLFGVVAGGVCLRDSHVIDYQIAEILVLLILILLIYSFLNLNKISKFIKTWKKLYIANIIVGFFLGGLVTLIINESDKWLGMVLFVLGYFFTLMISGNIFYKFLENTLKLYKVECENDSIEGYLIGVFNDFFKIKDKDNNIRFINKDTIKEIIEIDKSSVENTKKTNKSLKLDYSSEIEENTYLVKVKKIR